MKKLKTLLLFILVSSISFGFALSVIISPDLSNNDSIIIEDNGFSEETPSASATKDWTFMVYLDADCNLEGAGIDDINEMEMIGSDSNINIILQIDRIPGYDSSNGDWTGAKRYYITKDYSVSIISSTEVQNLGEVNMGSRSTLESFISWGKSNYPANNYALILWDHGSGVMWGSSPGGVCWDDTNSHDYLTLSEVKTALNNYPVDLVGFDACLMGAVEVHYQLKDCTNLQAIIASEEVEPGDGYPYNDILGWLQSNPSSSPTDLAQQIVIKYDNSYSSGYDITQSAAYPLNTSFITDLTAFINDLNSIAVSEKAQLQIARQNSQDFLEPSYIDLWDFADEVITQCIGADASAAALKTAISNIIIEERHSSHNPGSHGMTIYFPSSQSGYSTNYENHDFAILGWDEFLMKYYTGTGGSDYDDAFEENDDFDQAPLVTNGDYYNLISNGTDLDFFNVTLLAGNTIDVTITFEHSVGDIDLFFFNVDQIMVNDSQGVTDIEYLNYTAPVSGEYTILVDSYDDIEYQPYDLIINDGNDDSHEDNDDWWTPDLINANTTESELICKDPDFYYFAVKAGWLVNVTIEFDYMEGNLDLHLWNYTDEILIDSSTDGSGKENILWGSHITGWIQIEVRNYENNYNYTLITEVKWYDDNFEVNNRPWTGPNIAIDSTYHNLTCINEDWFEISLTEGKWINITIYFNNNEGDLDLVLYDPGPLYEIITVSLSYTDNEVIYYEAPSTDDYYILVKPYEINLNYTLCIHETALVWDDDFEENDYWGAPYQLDIGYAYNNLSALDWDVFVIYGETDYEITITLDYDFATGDLDLYVIWIDDDLYLVDLSATYSNQEQVIFEPYIDDWYFILIYLEDINMGYNLTITEKFVGEEVDAETTPTTINGFPLLFIIIISGLAVILLIKKKNFLKD